MMISHFQMVYGHPIHSILLLAHLEYLYHINSFHKYIPSIIIERIAIKLPPLTFSIDCNEGRSIHYYITFLLINQNILSIIVNND